MTDWITFGTHRTRFEEPDLCITIADGEITVQDMNAFVELQKKFSEKRPYLLAITDFSRFTKISPEARKILAQEARAIPLRGNVMIGASFQTRILSNLIMGAFNLFSKRDNPTHFCKTEGEARAWIEERRKILRAELEKQ